MLLKIDWFLERPLDFSNLDIYKCPKIDSTRLSFFGLLKNNFVKMQNVFKAFVVRELRGIEMLFFRKNQKIPKKEENCQKPLRHLWDVSKRLHKIDNEKKRDPFLVEGWKNTFYLHTKNFYMESKNVQKTRFYACLKTKSLYMVIDKMLKTHVEGLCLFASQ